MYRKLSVVKRIAKELNIKGKLEVSNKTNKRFMISLDNGDVIHFGLCPYKVRGAYIDNHGDKLKSAWKARHSKIMLDNEPAYLNIYSPEYYSYHLLW